MRRCATAALCLVAGCAGLAGCGSGSVVEPTSMRPVLQTIVRYEDRYKGDPSWGPMFCRVRHLGGSPTGTRFRIVVWEACQEYQAHRGRLVEQTGWTSPAAITIVRSGNLYRVVRDYQPAFLYPMDDTMFPDA